MRLLLACVGRGSRGEECQKGTWGVPTRQSSTHPEFFKLIQSVETLDLLYAVVADVEHAQLLVLRQTFDLENAVVREVQLLEVLQLRKPREDGDPVRLDGEDLEVLEGGQVL